MTDHPPRNPEQTGDAITAWDTREGARVWIGGHNTQVRRQVLTKLSHARPCPTGPIDAAYITPATVDEAVYFARKLTDRLRPDTNVWIVLPRRADANTGDLPVDEDALVTEMNSQGFSHRQTQTEEVLLLLRFARRQ